MSAAVTILGAGAWGTALAIHLSLNSTASPRVTLYARDPAQAQALHASRINARYLPDARLPDAVIVTHDLASAAGSELLLAATPVAALAELQTALPAQCRAPLFWMSKGFIAAAELPAGYGLAHQYLASRWPAPVGVVSGPSFAQEVARGLPTALSVASTDARAASEVADLLRGETLRAYESDDLPGVETGGAIKNVLAIAAGASDGLGFGHNARAALITRGLAETGRLLVALGGRRETLMGLAGLGDLVLTCTGDLSRNRRVGIALAQGLALDAILRQLGHVAEGVEAARAAHALARHYAIDMPIADVVYRVLYEGLPLRVAVADLLRREPKAEM
ncbi:MAG TPA: NAD(P)H-dependent glycerol-3-phosphate dehydrogenase [Casimicrobiaceae bacterium]|nr:NAD(P)H-dependent glycerol-3-phosphate dehydrogenase [Casimicrobiaceae bacterium]